MSTGAEWTAAPKPLMRDSLYPPYPSHEPSDVRWKEILSGNLGLSEDEPVWDAADFLRMGPFGSFAPSYKLGKDVIGQHSLATNLSGIEWVRRHLAPKGIRVHTMQFKNMKPRHIDDTLIALRPGIAVHSLETPPLNGISLGSQNEYSFFKDGIDMFKDSGWKVFQLPHSSFSRSLNINTLSIDDRTVFVEEKEIYTQKFFEDLGCRVIVIPFSKVYSLGLALVCSCLIFLGGSFHCCTLDVRRRGSLQSYFPALDDPERGRVETFSEEVDFAGF